MIIQHNSVAQTRIALTGKKSNKIQGRPIYRAHHEGFC